MTKCIRLWYWFIFLPYVSPFLKKKIVEGNKHRCVNKTSRDKGGACANEKGKRCNRILSEIIPSVEITLPRDLMCSIQYDMIGDPD